MRNTVRRLGIVMQPMVPIASQIPCCQFFSRPSLIAKGRAVLDPSSPPLAFPCPLFVHWHVTPLSFFFTLFFVFFCPIPPGYIVLHSFSFLHEPSCARSRRWAPWHSARFRSCLVYFASFASAALSFACRRFPFTFVYLLLLLFLPFQALHPSPPYR